MSACLTSRRCSSQLSLLLAALAAASGGVGNPHLKQVSVNGAELHYLDRGTGAPIVFVHRGVEDYQTWSAGVIDSLAREYRVIAYSRRHNFPNRNPMRRGEFSSATEAADLAEFIRALGLGPVHLVGHSYGGLTAAILATREPSLVRSLVLSEPAITA